MAVKAKAIKKPAIGNVSSDAVTQQEPIVSCKQEPESVGGLPPQGNLPKPRVAGTRKRRKPQKKQSLLQNPLVLVGMGVAAIFIISSIANANNASSLEKSMEPPVDGYASTDSEVLGWRR